MATDFQTWLEMNKRIPVPDNAFTRQALGTASDLVTPGASQILNDPGLQPDLLQLAANKAAPGKAPERVSQADLENMGILGALKERVTQGWKDFVFGKPEAPKSEPQVQVKAPAYSQAIKMEAPVGTGALFKAQGSLGDLLDASNTQGVQGVKDPNYLGAGLEDTIANFPVQPQADLSGLNDIATMVSKGAYKSSAKPPATAEELLSAKGKLQAALSQNRAELLKQFLQTGQAQALARVGLSESQGAEKPVDLKAQEEMAKFLAQKTNEFNQSPEVKGLLQTKTYAQKIRSLLDMKTPAADANIQTLLVRMRSDVGNASEWEQKVGTNFGSLPDKVKNYWNLLWSGKYADLNRNQLQEMINNFEEQANQGYRNFAAHRASQDVANKYPGAIYNDYYNSYIGNFSRMGAPKKAPAKAAPQEDARTPAQKKLDELRRKKLEIQNQLKKKSTQEN